MSFPEQIDSVLHKWYLPKNFQCKHRCNVEISQVRSLRRLDSSQKIIIIVYVCSKYLREAVWLAERSHSTEGMLRVCVRTVTFLFRRSSKKYSILWILQSGRKKGTLKVSEAVLCFERDFRMHAEL